MLTAARLRPSSICFRHSYALLTTRNACQSRRGSREYSTPAADDPQLPRRSYLYVPATHDEKLRKTLFLGSDVIVYDLEDSVPPTRADKEGARARLTAFIADHFGNGLPQPERLAVRVNAVNTPFFQDDILHALAPSCIRTLVIPKVHSAQDLDAVSTQIHAANSKKAQPDPINIVASIESAKALYNIGQISSWESEFGPVLGGKISALLFAAEDFCADTKIIRTKTREELLYARSQISITARAFGLESIDMVCVNYQDHTILKDECSDARRLGFTGKQAIHPSQVGIIHTLFLPTAKEILRAARILRQMEKAHSMQLGAAGLETEDGIVEMIDQPMIKQAEHTIRLAKSASLFVPQIE